MLSETSPPDITIDEGARRRFEAAWRTGHPEPIERFLPPEGDRRRRATLEELVLIEMELAWKASREDDHSPFPPPSKAEDYLARFPSLGHPAIILRLLRQEDRLRRARGEDPSEDEYRQRFPEAMAGGVEIALPAPRGRRFPEFPGHDVLEELGRGAMGVVYKARHRALGRTVAVKTLPPNMPDDPELLVRFLKEAGAVAALQHPNIVQIHEVSEHGGRPYFTMEYVEGGTLAQRLREGSPLPPREAASLIETVARALAHAHDRGIVHRDVKPGNILLAPDGVPKVSDFGLAKYIGQGQDMTQTGAVIGTPSYMAPEQASGHGRLVGVPADVYALGSILFELLTGRPPFKAATIMETLDLVRGQEPVPPTRLQPAVPRDLETICLKCLSKDPAQRYPRAIELADDLCRYLHNQPIHARPVGPFGRAVRWCRRQPALATTIALSLAAVLTVGSIGLWQVLAERDRYRKERDTAEAARNRAAAERDRAQANLYRALLGEAEVQLEARPTGWWWRVMDNLRNASPLATADGDRDALRKLALRAMASPYPSLRLHAACEGHAGAVTAVAVNHEAGLAASGGLDRTVRVWSLATGRQLAVMSSHTREITDVAFQPGGGLLASAALDGTVRLWNVAGMKAALAGSGAATPPKEFRVYSPLGGGGVAALAFSPDDKLLAAAFEDRRIRILPLDKEGDRKVNTLTGHTARINCLAFSPDGSQLASGAEDGTVRCWDVATAKEIRSLGGLYRPTHLAFFPGGDKVVTTDAETFGVQVRSLKIKQKYGRINMHTAVISSLRMDVRGRLLTASRDGSVKFWNPDERMKELAVAAVEGGDVLCADMSSDAAWIVAGYGDGRVRLWKVHEPSQCGLIDGSTQSVAFLGASRRLASGVAVYDLASGIHAAGISFRPPAVRALSVHPDGRRLAYGTERGDVCLWDIAARGQVAAWAGHVGPITSLRYSPDGSLLASAGVDGLVKIWKGTDGPIVAQRDAGLGEVHGIAWSHDGRRLALTGKRGAIVWDPEANSEPRRLADHQLSTSCIAAGAAHVALAGGDESIAVFDLHSGSRVHTLRGHTATVTALEFAADGQRLASAALDDTLRFWDVASGTAAEVLEERNPAVSWLAFDPRGRYFASGGGAAMLWIPAERHACARLLPGGDLCGGFTADGAQLLLGTAGGSVRTCGTAEAEQRFKARGQAEGPVRIDPFGVIVSGGHLDAVWGVAASRDGRWLATASHDTTVKLWDAKTMQLKKTLVGHNNMVWSAAFSPDSKYLASGSVGPIKVWDVETGHSIHDLVGHQKLVVSVAFHPSQPWLASSADDGTLRCWDLTTGRQKGILYQSGYLLHGLAFRPDGRWLAAASADHRVLLWDLGKPAAFPSPPDRLLTEPVAPVWSVAFSDDGLLLASAGANGQALLWDGRTFARIVQLPCGNREMRCATFSADGGLLAVAGYAAPTYVWGLAAVRRTLRDLQLDW